MAEKPAGLSPLPRQGQLGTGVLKGKQGQVAVALAVEYPQHHGRAMGQGPLLLQGDRVGEQAAPAVVFQQGAVGVGVFLRAGLGLQAAL
jgi:hypothetical protein